MTRAAFLKVPNGRGGFHSSHFRHLHIHEHQIKRLVGECLNGLASIGCDRDLVPPFLQNAHRQPLIHRVVFSQKNAARAHTLFRGRTRLFLRAAGRTERGHDGVAQFGLLDGFYYIRFEA